MSTSIVPSERAADRGALAAPLDDGPRQREARAGRRRSATRIALGGALPILLIALWYAATAFDWVPAHKLPSPDAVIVAGIDLWERGLLGMHITISVQRVLLGFAIGAAAGLVIGAIVGLSRFADGVLAPTVGAVRAVPSLAWVPLLILYLGFGEDSKVTLVAIGALFPVYTTVAGALRHVDPHLVEMGRAYGYTRSRLLLTVQLPAVIPAIISGLRLALAQAWLFLVAAELVGSTMGLGFLLIESQGNLRYDRLFLAILALGVIGKTTDALIGIGERALLKRWG
ncbi:MAG: ABC transporter permease [Microcella pacifica]|uniref:ABC transporter permease n=1 Tax=Microcella pacifica TaxID=2591847 RepID=A0A9E5JKA0_9MICO|nr:ABC transporter permease [Microcella pacifica]MBR21617.1 nitrate ABC transporter permease [Leifsonia sp.]MBU1249593.1 ABC transporter permease [Actinomycetota bacterium]MBU1609718.1 ABC transporter permease [Actinomycetota bacterium]MBU2316223.1 ABC transporter permease [Actinomycetota bacterium]MBU2385699.1 ABC transporter permease [Actinomycetota bacterium]